MPLEDALRLIQQNFEDYLKKNVRQSGSQELPLPSEVRSLLLELLDSRPLSYNDLDKIIKHMQERQSALGADTKNSSASSFGRL